MICCFTLEERKLEYDRPLIWKQRKQENLHKNHPKSTFQVVGVRCILCNFGRYWKHMCVVDLSNCAAFALKSPSFEPAAFARPFSPNWCLTSGSGMWLVLKMRPSLLRSKDIVLKSRESCTVLGFLSVQAILQCSRHQAPFMLRRDQIHVSHAQNSFYMS